MGIYFARYILFLDGRFSFCPFFLLDCRLHTFLFSRIVVYIDPYIKRGTSIVRGATALVLSVEDKVPILASTVSSWWCRILLVFDLSFFFTDCRFLDCVFIFLIRIVSHDFIIVFVFVFYCNSLDSLSSRAAVAVQILFSLGVCGESSCWCFLILAKSEQVVRWTGSSMCLFRCVSCLCSYLLPPVFHLFLQSLSEYIYGGGGGVSFTFSTIYIRILTFVSLCLS